MESATAGPRVKLLIAVPALNEEESIEGTIRACLEARQDIVAGGAVDEVEITVVSDGSTDRTVEIARRYEGEVNLIVFETNRGYGAAIKEAWRRSDATLLGFMDADGTCDPRFFRRLCETLHQEQADVALGSRMGRTSRMPALRRAGNTLFAGLLSTISATRVKDTASGMRVVRRDRLRELMPLPDGLHFTPAMSARAILGGSIRIVEVPMPYHEREGESKLRVVRDGLRFLRVILDAALLLRPSRALGLPGLLALVVAAGLMVVPVAHYARTGTVAEWMIYRFVVSNLLGSVGVLLLGAAYLTGRMVNLALGHAAPARWSARLGRDLFRRAWWWVLPLLLVVAGGLLVLPSFLQLVETGGTYEHWSRFIAMSFFYQVAFILVAIKAVDYALDLLEVELRESTTKW